MKVKPSDALRHEELNTRVVPAKVDVACEAVFGINIVC